MKKFVLGLLIGIMLTMGVTTYAVPEIKEAVFSDIRLMVNGETLDTEVVSVTKTDSPNYMTNYIPARALAESLGGTVTWDSKERVISVNTSTVYEVPEAESTKRVQLPSVVEIRGIKAVSVVSVYNALKESGYDLVNAVKKDTLQIVKDNKIVVKDITFILSDENQVYIKYDFYEVNILPLLQ